MISNVIADFLSSSSDDDQSAPDQPDTRSPDEEYLPADDRVLQLLSHNDGFRWQGQIADEFDWSASKTSRVLCQLENEGLVERRRIGREKVIFLPGAVPDSLNDLREESHMSPDPRK